MSGRAPPACGVVRPSDGFRCRRAPRPITGPARAAGRASGASRRPAPGPLRGSCQVENAVHTKAGKAEFQFQSCSRIARGLWRTTVDGSWPLGSRARTFLVQTPPRNPSHRAPDSDPHDSRKSPKKRPLPACPPVGVIGLSSIGGISGGHHRPRLALLLSTPDDRRQHGHPSVVPPVPQAVAQLDHGEGRSGRCVGEPRAGGPGGAGPSLSSVSTPCLASPRADSAPDRNTGLARHPESEAMIALDTCSIDLYTSKHENDSAPPACPARGHRRARGGVQGPRPSHATPGVLLLGARQGRGPSGRAPVGGGGARAHVVPPPRPAAAGGADREPERRAVHLLFRAAGYGHGAGARADRLLLGACRSKSSHAHE